MGFHERMAVLRSYEQLCYQICMYIMRCDEKALESARRTLIRLAHNEDFFTSAGEEQVNTLRKESVKQALHLLREKARPYS